MMFTWFLIIFGAVSYVSTSCVFFLMFRDMCPDEPGYKWKAFFLWPIMSIVMICAYVYIHVRSP